MKKMIRLATSCCIATASALAASNPDVWTNAPLGIAITECSYDAHGVDVRFVTDLQPPYLVGVYRSEEIGLGRRFPVNEVRTESRHVRIPVRTMEATLFVQVMTEGAEDNSRRIISQSEYQSFIDRIRSAEVAVNTDPGSTWEFVRDDPAMQLVSDNTWVGFRKSQLPDVTFSFSGRTSVVERLAYMPLYFCKVDTARYVFQGGIPAGWSFDPKANWASRKSSTFTNRTVRCEFDDDRETQSGWYYGIAKLSINKGEAFELMSVTNGANAYFTALRYHDVRKGFDKSVSTPVYGLSDKVTFTSTVTNADVSVGTGYRVLFFCDRNEVIAQRAYSAQTNMSDEVIIERGFKSLSTHEGFRYTKDFDGRIYLQADTNAVQDIIHLEGIR